MVQTLETGSKPCAWLAANGYPDEPMDGYDAAVALDDVFHWLDGCSKRPVRRGFSKERDARAVARLTPPEDIAERVRAILAQILPPTARVSR